MPIIPNIPTRKRAVSDARRPKENDMLAPGNYVPMHYFNSPRMVPLPMSPGPNYHQMGYHPYPGWPSPYSYPVDMPPAVPAFDPRAAQVHVLLAPPGPIPMVTANPHLLYDVRYKPERCYAYTDPRSPIKLPDDMAEQYATNPPTQKMRLISRDLPWRITVINSKGVTIHDIVKAVHAELHQPLTEGEWWIAQEEERERTLEAYKGNCGEGEESKEFKRKPEEGVKRVDWLGKKTMLISVTRTPMDDSFIKQRVVDPKAQDETWVMGLGEASED